MRQLRSHCKRGHEFTPDNTGLIRNKTRFCIKCDTNRKAKHYEQKVKPTFEYKEEVFCPSCKTSRLVVAVTAKKLAKDPTALCRRCTTKQRRGSLSFTPKICARCFQTFTCRSGATRYCDTCAARPKTEPRNCPVCGKRYLGYRNKTACSSRCAYRVRSNETYFGGRMFEAEGWSEKTCRICDKAALKKVHVHHVFGHPDHSRLVVLCPGCHDMISQLAGRKRFERHHMERAWWYVMAQRLGADPGWNL